MLPKVTVLMPVYNATEFLGEAVESIVSQSFCDLELVVIDDGSDEPLDAILDQFKDDRIVLVRQENQGLTRALNRGIRMARGTFIARMDGDDVSLPDRLQIQVTEMESNLKMDLVGSYFDVIDAAGNLTERKEPFTDPIYRLWRLQFHNNYGHGTVMLRKDALIKAGMYDERLRYAQDYDLWSRLSAKNNTKMIPKALYRYRLIQESSQSSVKNYEAQLANAIMISDRNLKACNPALTADECVLIRTLYWKFQLEHVSVRGLSLIPNTLAGFCRRYGIEGQDKSALYRSVVRDALEEVQTSLLSPSEKKATVAKIQSWC